MVKAPMSLLQDMKDPPNVSLAVRWHKVRTVAPSRDVVRSSHSSTNSIAQSVANKSASLTASRMLMRVLQRRSPNPAKDLEVAQWHLPADRDALLQQRQPSRGRSQKI
eukprot:gnl/MRDRNA2_/MRDRNA2_53226_c0_seq1.p3 gnl/MRDRNA2_/MRDRNA2_53226_c0~~gnl/MRDRNA2_/MRDRNA2_53226_c0_seq1.p3  ORF type:complete len:108 (-),score=17.85 gnl/MRDRNA2_/MRDRNA2_53226_c0_seq1:148-471(-)